MRIINRYIVRSLLSVFLTSMLVITFLMISGAMLRILNMMDGDLSFVLVLKIFLGLLPDLCSYSIPISLVVAVTLVFSRMSGESEIVALRAGGVSLWQLLTAPVLLALAACALCLYFNLELGPRCKFRQEILLRSMALSNPELLLQPGVSSSIGGKSIYVGEKAADGTLLNIRILEMDKRTGIVTREVLAQEGRIEESVVGQLLRMRFTGVSIRTVEPVWEEGTNLKYVENATLSSLKVNRIQTQESLYTIDLQKEMNDNELQKRVKFMTLVECVARLKMLNKIDPQQDPDRKETIKEISQVLCHLSKRLAMGLSPLVLLLLALPFGFRSARSETSAGLVASLVIVVGYFGLLLLIGTLERQPGALPHVLIWLPNILFEVTGLYLLAKVVRA